MAYLSGEEIKKIGFLSVGDNVLISEKVSIYNASNISVGSNVRVDDFCVISAGKGGVVLGNNVHVAVYCSLIGDGSIVLEDFVGLSSRVSVYSSSDDYSGSSLTNPTVPVEYKKTHVANVCFERHVIIGAGSVVLPGVTVGEGSAVGALSLVAKNVDDWSIVSGVPAKRVKGRRKDLLDLENLYVSRF